MMANILVSYTRHTRCINFFFIVPMAQVVINRILWIGVGPNVSSNDTIIYSRSDP